MAATRNVCAGGFGRAYDFYIERPWLAQVIGRALWGMDPSVLYASMGSITAAGSGATIVDVPCGGGVAFRALSPDQNVRYIAGDLDEKMLARATRRAHARSLKQVELIIADMEALPIPDNTADVFVSFSGLHMLKRPDEAAAEMGRCLKPGGELIGTTFLSEGSRRQRAIFRAGRPPGHAEPPSRLQLQRAFEAAGVEELTITPAEGFASFHGRKP
jgi:ubiquinone/menaquinone biosynthesis C-methylase UbiE